MIRVSIGVGAVLAVAASMIPAAGKPVAAPTPGPWSVACRYDTGLLPELSGLAPSVRHKRLLWAVNDSGNAAVVYGLDARTCRVRARLTLTGGLEDAEALATGRNRRGRPVIWVGDIGDNAAGRSHVSVVEVREPPLGDSRRSGTVHRFRYADGPRDAEALMAAPGGRRLHVISKTFPGAVHRLPVRRRAVTARRIGPAPGFATDAARSPAGDGYAVRDYLGIQLFSGGVPGRADARTSPPPLPQAEAVAYSRNGRWLYTASERDDRLLRSRLKH